jgi:hypothetical protein
VDNSSKIILDLCGGTGAWSKPYKDAGYDVRNITLPEYDVFTYEPPKNVYGILASPPCTMFSLARTRAKKPRDLRQGMELVIACLNIIWECRYHKKLAFWCLENPMGILRQFLGKPVFSFHPWEFGDPWTKKTDLWGYFNIPKKRPIKMTPMEQEISRRHLSRKSLFPSISDITSSKQKEIRAITPPGFAGAFYRANK